MLDCTRAPAPVSNTLSRQATVFSVSEGGR